MSTQAVTYTVPSPGWTGTVDVTDANLLSDASVKDFTIFYDGIEQGSTQLALWTKTSYTQLTYAGAALTTGNIVTVQRRTPTSVVQTVTPQSTILSSLWNAEFDRVTRRAEEYATFWMSTTPATGTIVDTAFASNWNAVTGDAPSKNAVYDIFNGTVISCTPTWTFLTGSSLILNSGTTFTVGCTTSMNGATTFANTTTFNASSNVVFNSACPITGTVDADAATAVLVPARAKVDAGGEHTTNAASQIWVLSHIPYIFQARLSVSNTDPLGKGTGTTIYLHPYNGNAVSLYDATNTRWELHWLSAAVSLNVGTMTDNLPYDIFLYNNAGTLTMEKLAWTSATARATALTTQNGVYVLTGATNKRYIGTMFSPTSNTINVKDVILNHSYSSGYTTAVLYNSLVNYYNAIPNQLTKIDYAGLSSFMQNSKYQSTNAVQPVYYDGDANYARFAFASTGLGHREHSIDYVGGTNSTYAYITALHNTFTTPANIYTAGSLLGYGGGLSFPVLHHRGNTTAGYNAWAIYIISSSATLGGYNSSEMTLSTWY